jgi:shikimate dehydrogenase
MKKLCVIGDPVSHSLSPVMHNAAIKHLGLQKKFNFTKKKVTSEGLANFILKAREEKITGLSVTMPHKQAIIPLLDILSKEAMLAQAVNTVTLAEGSLAGSQMIVGHNTDGIGCVKALETAGVRVHGQTIVLLGAGGAAKAIAVSLGLNGVKELHILNRTPQAAKDIVETLRKISGAAVEVASIESMEEALADADILINATPVGMKGVRKKTIVPAKLIEQHMVVFDIVYHPAETPLLRDARKIGAQTISGTEMLLHQGALQFKLFTGHDAPIDVMRAALNKHLEAKP